MSRWRRSISLIALSVVAGLPVSGTVCAALCASAASAAPARETYGGVHHHGSGSTTSGRTASPEQPGMVGVLGHDCLNHDGGVGDATEALTAIRADTSFLTVGGGLSPSTPAVFGLTATREHSGSGPPFRIPSPTRALLVLRI